LLRKLQQCTMQMKRAERVGGADNKCAEILNASLATHCTTPQNVMILGTMDFTGRNTCEFRQRILLTRKLGPVQKVIASISLTLVSRRLRPFTRFILFDIRSLLGECVYEFVPRNRLKYLRSRKKVFYTNKIIC